MEYIKFFAPFFVIPVLYSAYVFGWLKGYEHREKFEKELKNN
jgi:hypothetical protein